MTLVFFVDKNSFLFTLIDDESHPSQKCSIQNAHQVLHEPNFKRTVQIPKVRQKILGSHKIRFEKRVDARTVVVNDELNWMTQIHDSFIKLIRSQFTCKHNHAWI
jgi:hypothetical protein